VWNNAERFFFAMHEFDADFVDIANVLGERNIAFQDSARRPRRVLVISSRRSSIVIESPRGACTRK
jgi:hypothetical protein